ncbi:GNAT family N-acetyltransferase [Mesorhizobium sp. B4-1-4]|uniref:GNAT family N-acetyltransferase n=1 Tax=Mesorhizobium sp. B4-1-4 TaxID=2589888 RepID=UPI0015E38217|nr:GNAT family N-acetyltransferase [Mesorhizobium sp. B4-1-4]
MYLKPASDDDFEFSWELFSESVHPLITPYLPEGWNPEREKRQFSLIWRPSKTMIVQSDASAIGWFSIDDAGASTVLENIFICAPYRRLGIGSKIVSDIVRHAELAGKSVRLSLLRNNPCAPFYASLGFRTIASSKLTIDMST